MSFLLLETGDYLLLEDGGKLILDELPPPPDEAPVGRAGRSHHSIVLSRRIIASIALVLASALLL